MSAVLKVGDLFFEAGEILSFGLLDNQRDFR
jgi:hypothetical protein